MDSRRSQPHLGVKKICAEFGVALPVVDAHRAFLGEGTKALAAGQPDILQRVSLAVVVCGT